MQEARDFATPARCGITGWKRGHWTNWAGRAGDWSLWRILVHFLYFFLLTVDPLVPSKKGSITMTTTARGYTDACGVDGHGGLRAVSFVCCRRGGKGGLGLFVWWRWRLRRIIMSLADAVADGDSPQRQDELR